MGRGVTVLQQNSQAIPQRQHDAIKQHLILLPPAHDIQHNVALHLEDDDLAIIQDHIARGFVGLVEEALFECFLGLDGRVGVWRRGEGVLGEGGGGGGVGRGVVFCEDAGAVVGAEEEDGVDGEEGEVGGHAADGGWGWRARWRGARGGWGSIGEEVGGLESCCWLSVAEAVKRDHVTRSWNKVWQPKHRIRIFILDAVRDTN